MIPYYRKQSAIVLLIASIQIVSLASAMINRYTVQRLPKDSIYYWAYTGLILGCLSILMSIVAFLGWVVPYVYPIWVMLMVFLSLVLTIMAIVLFPSPNGWLVTLWVVLTIVCILTNSFGTYAVIPLSPTHLADYGITNTHT